MGTDSGYGGNQTLEKPRPASGGERAPASSDGVDGDAFVAALLGEQTELARRVREAIQLEIPVYRSMAAEALDIEVRRELRPLLRSGSGKRALTDREHTKLDALGEQRARQGVPIDDVLHAWRIGIEIVVGYAREVGQRRGVAEARVLEFVQSVLAWSDLAIMATTRAHRRAERAVARGSDECRANFVRDVLLGTISRAELRVQADIYGLDPAVEYVAVRARLGENLAPCELERTLGVHAPAHGRCGLCALVNGDAAGFSSQAPPKDIDGIIGFGPPRPLERLAESYRSAARALVTAEACGLQGAYDIASLGLRPAVALDVEVGELLRRRYLDPLGAASSAGELIATLRAYLACGTHVERTATRLFVHQNTVRYRIARFEELTGTSLGDTEVLLEVWWALELSSMHL